MFFCLLAKHSVPKTLRYRHVFTVGKVKVKGWFFFLHARKVYLGTTWGWVVTFTPRPLFSQEGTLSNWLRGGWPPEPFWTFQRRDKFLTTAQILTTDLPACSLVTLLTTRPRLPWERFHAGLWRYVCDQSSHKLTSERPLVIVKIQWSSHVAWHCT
jgi:hypothetical protein